MRGAKGRARRAEEQARIEVLYRLGHVEELFRVVDQGIATKQVVQAPLSDVRYAAFGYGRPQLDVLDVVFCMRSYRCPRCDGDHFDPEDRGSWSNYDQPPDPCGLCNGHGILSPRPWVGRAGR